MQNMRVGKIYRLTKKIGQGAFGEIFLALNQKTDEEFAVKLESVRCPHPQLFFEAKLYQYLHSEATDFEKGVPKVFYSGTEGEHNVMVMDLLGPSLEDLFNKVGRKFTLKTGLMLMDQMLTRIEYIHNRLFIHRDLKPDNFLMGVKQNAHRLYLVDFGLAKKYVGKDGKHIPYKENKNLTGTARYASINTHLGVEQSRRDDLESIAYVMMYFLRGSLPWMNLKPGARDDQYEKIMEKKMATSAESLCKGFPGEFVEYLNYAKGLKFEEKPDYKRLRGIFRDLMRRNGWEYDGGYDWVPEANRIPKSSDKENQANNNPQIPAKTPENLPKEEPKKPDINLKRTNSVANNAKPPPAEEVKRDLQKPTAKAPAPAKNDEKIQTQPKILKKNSLQVAPKAQEKPAPIEQKYDKNMLKTFQSSLNYAGPRIVVNKASYK